MDCAKFVNCLALLFLAVAPLGVRGDSLQDPADPAAEAAAGKRVRQLAPGVLTVVPPNDEVKDTVSRHDLVEILTADPKFGERDQSVGNSPAKETTFRHDIWGLEFAFKPLRFIQVTMPDEDGKLVKKNVWYMVYRVSNTGHVMKPEITEPAAAFDGVAAVKTEKGGAVKFAPQFFLESPEFNKVYPDRILPLAVDAIRKREDPNRKFFDSVDIVGEIPVGKSIWGVATWEDIDPRIDRIHVYVAGLTNAYRWVDPKDQNGKYRFKDGDSLGAHRQLAKKMLQLNFWRPGDEFLEHEGEIRLGLPGEVDYTWAYR
jgi:hypothetical protein